MKSKENFVKREGVCYVSEAGDEFSFQDLLIYCNGNLDLVQNLYDLVEWQHPTTLLDEWYMEGEIDEDFNLTYQDEA